MGVADLDDPRPIAAADRYRIGSVTKMYTATLVLRLAAEGLLRLGDRLEALLRGLVPGGAQITVETLLRLRSGLPDYTTALFGDPPTDLSALDRYWSPRRLIAVALGSEGRIPPGTEYRYCNVDYILLGMVIEAVTGQRLDAQMWQRIIRPLKLRDTMFPTVDPYLCGPHAKGCVRTSPDAPYTECTTITRLARMIEPTQQLDEYRGRGLGVVRYDFGYGPDKVAYGHTGGVPGYTNIAMRTVAGRCVVLWQNGIEPAGVLNSDAAFVQAALRG